MFGIVVNNAILLINRFRLQVREIVAEEGYRARTQVPAKRRLGGFDLWRLPGAERQRVLRKAIVDGHAHPDALDPADQRHHHRRPAAPALQAGHQPAARTSGRTWPSVPSAGWPAARC